MASFTIFTPEKEEEFLAVLRETANVSRAAEEAGVSRVTVYNHRKQDDAFRQRWDDAVEIGTDALEDEATRRGMEGWDEPVFFRGLQTATIRKYSDTLLIVQLKARRPQKYRENVHTEHSGTLTVEGLLAKLGR